ncbi:MAG: hypothetical protein E6G59_03635 [Actinobacteria bacterium]|nr:MAG: hypothetical protein E6G59_03635 [Actinomycetota bacterium]
MEPFVVGIDQPLVVIASSVLHGFVVPGTHDCAFLAHAGADDSIIELRSKASEPTKSPEVLRNG